MPWTLLLLLTACNPERRIEIRENRNKAALMAAATAYWDAVRWSDSAAAALFLGTAEERLRLGRHLAEPKSRISDVSVVTVEVDPADPSVSVVRGTALVRIDGYDLIRGKAAVDTVEQYWIKLDRSWHVDAERSPVGDERPW